MSISVIAILRVVHIVLGAFWLGAAIAVGFFLLPAARATGLNNAQFAAQFTAIKRVVPAMAVSGAMTVLAGFALYAGIWAGTGFSGPAVWYANGGHFAIVAILLAIFVVRPAANKLGALASTLTSQGSPPTAEQDHERERLMSRLVWVTRVNALLLLVAIGFMAIGRYV